MALFQDDDYIEFEVEIMHCTEKAALVEIEGEEIWLPFSVVDDLEDCDKGDIVTVRIPEWFCEKKGIG